MQYKFFTFPVATNEIMEEELNKFLRSNKIVEIEKHIIIGTSPMWSICIGYLLFSQKYNETSPKINYEQILDKTEFANFENLRDIRKQVAQELKIPAYAVFTNKELAELSKLENITPQSLLSLDGFGSGRMEKVGTQFLSKLKYNVE